jgi:hypothetical protein
LLRLISHRNPKAKAKHGSLFSQREEPFDAMEKLSSRLRWFTVSSSRLSLGSTADCDSWGSEDSQMIGSWLARREMDSCQQDLEKQTLAATLTLWREVQSECEEKKEEGRGGAGRWGKEYLRGRVSCRSVVAAAGERMQMQKRLHRARAKTEARWR